MVAMVVGMTGVSSCCEGGGMAGEAERAAGVFIWPQ